MEAITISTLRHINNTSKMAGTDAQIYEYDHKVLLAKFKLNSNPEKRVLSIPFYWIPIVYKVVCKILEINPDIIFESITEKHGRLDIQIQLIDSPKRWLTIRQVFFEAREEIDEITQERILEFSKRLRK